MRFVVSKYVTAMNINYNKSESIAIFLKIYFEM